MQLNGPYCKSYDLKQKTQMCRSDSFSDRDCDALVQLYTLNNAGLF